MHKWEWTLAFQTSSNSMHVEILIFCIFGEKEKSHVSEELLMAPRYTLGQSRQGAADGNANSALSGEPSGCKRVSGKRQGLI